VAVSLGEKAEQNDGSIAIVKRNKLWTEAREFTRVYQVLATLEETEDQVRAAPGVPAIGFIMNGAVCRKHQVKEVSPVMNPITNARGALYDVTCSFDNDVNADDAENGNTTPTARRPVCRWRCETVEEALPRDRITGDPIANTADTQVHVQAPCADYIREITRYEYYPFDPTVFLYYHNRINSSPFYGAPIGCAWLFDIETQEEDIDGLIYENVTYRVRFRLREDPENPGFPAANAWKGTFLNYGAFGRDYDTPLAKVRPLVDKATGERVEKNLNQNGAPLLEGEDPIFLSYNQFYYGNIGALNLGPYA
jgi:hypothetical protein